MCRLDNEWHHIAATWSWEDGKTQLYFDGQKHKPYFKREGFNSELKSPEEGGVDDHMAAQTTRSDLGERPPPLFHNLTPFPLIFLEVHRRYCLNADMEHHT